MSFRYFIPFFLFLLSLLSSQNPSNANDTMNITQNITSNQTLVSSGGSFELGFFSPGNSNNWYVGIWYRKISISTIVWVANRETPLKNSTSGVLKIMQPGILVLINDTNGIIWSSNTSRAAHNPVAQLLDSGNLVLRDENDENYLWQSFDYPTDSILPGMEFGLNSVTGQETYLSSWRTSDDPAPGEFTAHLDPTGYLQVIIKRGAITMYRMWPWNGLIFSGIANARENFLFHFVFGLYKNREGEFYYRDDAIDETTITRYTLTPNGAGQRLIWIDQTHGWVNYQSTPTDYCDNYKLCGAYGSCNIMYSPMCGCLDRFVPKNSERWIKADWSDGCVRRTPLNCTVGDGFVKYSEIKLPDATTSWYNESMNLEECRVECLRKCSCMAYTSLNISQGGSGCILWFGHLVDIRVLSANGQDLYIRMASSELDSNGKRNKGLIAGVTAVGIVLLGLTGILHIWKRKNNHTLGRYTGITNGKDLELPLFDLSTISRATDNFSIINKIGEGGYGPVYKGTLEEGVDIAVKRLSKTSKQGLDEFLNEVFCIAKLQHRNLVKLLGCCIQGEEKMLIYEYMSNKSLDFILFNQTSRKSLDWSKRLQIINGIARGLLYLHQDSRVRIIHRDLKASNILLDAEMNPKISDFGIAKQFIETGTEEMTRRVVGTYGYMSPEYAFRGRFSVKSDVFSFGVLVLEIASGKRNNSYSREDCDLNLLGHAWTLYKEERPIELADSYLYKLDNIDEVVRVIHLGLLCVQKSPNDRPSMSSVVAMLSNDSVLPEANPPGFFTDSNLSVLSKSNANPNQSTCTNEITITALGGR